MRLDFPLLFMILPFTSTLGRRSRLVTRGLDGATPLPTAGSGGHHPSGQGTRCPSSTTACLRHRSHGGQNHGGAPAALDCIDTNADFRSCGGCLFPRKGQDRGEDCTQIEGAAEADCECGTCIVRSCRPGYIVDSTGEFCTWHGIVDASAESLRKSKEGVNWWWWS
ncbi:hypothetical protein C8R45DRAFT_1131938 [Mycena sanguinolenta]|nr:hypothetical protein C8R45DRAFT_1131938 [Mycena sanguinolenta]